jgi:hypothetical protein
LSSAGAEVEAEAEVEVAIEAVVAIHFIQDDAHSKMTQETLKVEQCEQAVAPNVVETVLNAAHEDRAQQQELLMG